jgi:hypothetical protein
VPQFRVTKYSPQHRDLSGAYQRADWTSISDVGRDVEGGHLTQESYQTVEDAYIEVALAFLTESGCNSLRVTVLENARDFPNAPGEGSTLSLQGIVQDAFAGRLRCIGVARHATGAQPTIVQGAGRLDSRSHLVWAAQEPMS